jgi:hypothetical protein
MYITCTNCLNPKYRIDYGPTECDICHKWNSHDGKSPIKTESEYHKLVDGNMGYDSWEFKAKPESSSDNISCDKIPDFFKENNDYKKKLYQKEYREKKKAEKILEIEKIPKKYKRVFEL